MEVPPLTFTVLQLTPPSCIPTHPPSSPLTPVPSDPVDWPPLPANFSISPSPHYPAPFGTMSLGETFRTQVRLTNSSNEPVLGVKMMLEMQGPSGRFRLGEIVHNDGKSQEGEGEGAEAEEGAAEREPELEIKGEVDMDVKAEMKDVGVNLLICSVAWETAGGRKTFQRFFKFNVTPPLAIKTRVHHPTSPSILLEPARRSDTHLEILVQNTSSAGLAFDKVLLEPVKGLLCRQTTEAEYKDKHASPGHGTVTTLFPDDTRQYLFTLSPDPDYPPADQTDDKALGKSVFPPTYVPGTVLPLGRLDVAWFSAPYRNPGRLQTSTLNRRVPIPPAIPGRPLLPTRTSTALPPTPGAAPLASPLPHGRAQGADAVAKSSAEWEYDLVLLEVKREVEVERQFEVKLRLAARSPTIQNDDEEEAPAIRLALQYLSHPPLVSSATRAGSHMIGQTPTFALSPPSRSATPLSPPGRSFASPPPAGPSRPMTPISSQLRQATSSTIGLPPSTPRLPDLAPPSHLPNTTFPPPPYLSAPPAQTTREKGQVTHLGCSLVLLPSKACERMRENTGTTYVESTDKVAERWEVVYEHTLRYIALDEGMSELGGVRVLLLDDETGLAGAVGKEWETLGDIWVTA